MKTILIKLIAGLIGLMLPASDPAVVRASAAADDVIVVVQKRVEPAHREKWARILFAWGYYEASWWANPKGSNDQGAACGVMQVHNPEKYLDGASCARVRADRQLGFAVGLELLLKLEKDCGSTAGALTAYSMDGACKPYVIPLVASRCKKAGLTASCVER